MIDIKKELLNSMIHSKLYDTMFANEEMWFICKKDFAILVWDTSLMDC